MLYDLRRAALPIKWLVTCLLATLGLSYLFGALMISLYAGFTPQRVAATYAGPEMSMRMPPETTMVVRSEEHTSELQSPCNLVCRLLLEKKKKKRPNVDVSLHAQRRVKR